MGSSNSKPPSDNNNNDKSNSTKQSIPVQDILAFCVKNHSDLPNIIEVLNKAAPSLFKVQLADSEILTREGGLPASNVNMKLSVVIALCGTDRVDIVDKELLDTLRGKGFSNVIMIILRRGNNPGAFKGNSDNSINSGVGSEKVLIQLVHFKGEILNAENNTANITTFVRLAKLALG